MKFLLILTLSVFSVSAFAEFDYSCDLFPGEQGGNTLLIRINGTKAKVFTISYGEQEPSPRLIVTLKKIGSRNSLIKHYVENLNGNGLEFMIRKGAGTLGRIDHRTRKFRLYECSREDF